jgi:hypothetical protein
MVDSFAGGVLGQLSRAELDASQIGRPDIR